MKLSKMSDEQALAKFIEFLETRVSVTTGFGQNEDGILTSQFLAIRCGELEVISQPEMLQIPLRVATAEELKETVN